ncbi:MAG TPA: SDR family NAD(P)-dependent oxidoreductase [Burkholderiales bacterium]|nr:SDR family NAD(P)-dependent oxidoreductase [Burkholderiales bacterium]
MLLVTGIAAGFGVSIAAEFAAAGYDVLGLARSSQAPAHAVQLVAQAGGRYTHLACDITRPAEAAEVLRPHAGRIDVLVHNAAMLLIKDFAETTADEFEQVWRVCSLGAFVAGQIVLPQMAARGSGTVIFSGATAGRRGAAKFAAFASAKFALRGLAQSLAREYGPKGVHVAHVVLDGLIDEAQTDQRFGPAPSGRMEPQALARAYLGLATQHPSAWTHELDLRPFAGRF